VHADYIGHALFVFLVFFKRTHGFGQFLLSGRIPGIKIAQGMLPRRSPGNPPQPQGGSQPNYKRKGEHKVITR
jgi:hypothetical protein